MIYPLAMTLIGAGLLLTVWTGVHASLRRPASGPQLIAAIALEISLLGQSAIALARLPGVTPAEPVTFIAYAIGILAPLPLGIWVARLERTRWGSIALCFTALVVTVMTLRLDQLWRTRA